MDGCFVTDEWIVDGFYFAVAMHSFQNLIHGPWQLDEPPEDKCRKINAFEYTDRSRHSGRR